MLKINNSICLECAGCVPLCPEEALFLSFVNLEVDMDLCILCSICVDFCPVGAIEEKNAVAV